MPTVDTCATDARDLRKDPLIVFTPGTSANEGGDQLGQANGEANHDGESNNRSRDCGSEGRRNEQRIPARHVSAANCSYLPPSTSFHEYTATW